jgi:hypothetical protein
MHEASGRDRGRARGACVDKVTLAEYRAGMFAEERAIAGSGRFE